MDKKIMMYQVWTFHGIRWVIASTNPSYVTLVPVDKWNDKSNSDYIPIPRNQLLKDGEFISENIDDYLLPKNKDTDERKHSHYYKDVRHLDYIDIYRFCDLFIENDPSGALHHAIKKLAACGRRGAGKDEIKDLKEAADTINRKIEMLEEDMVKNK